MDALWSDWRLAARSLRKSPGFTAVIVLTLALGIGASTAIFSVVYGVLLRPFPFRAPESLVVIGAEQTFGGQVRGANYSALELDGWQERAHAFSSIGMWSGTVLRFRTSTGTQTVPAAYVSLQFFATLDERMLLGRPLEAADSRIPAVVISERLWRREFAGSSDAVGHAIVLNDRTYSIIGIVPGDFQFPTERTDVWTPVGYAQMLGDEPRVNTRRGGGFLFVARLRPSVTVADARNDANAVARTLATDFPDVPGRARRPVVVTLRDWFTDTTRPALMMLFAAVGLTLLVACANAMNLLLARQTARTREFAVRRALGASSARLLSYAMAETGLLAIASGILGVTLAVGSVRAFASMWPVALPRVDAIRVDSPILTYAGMLSIATALVCAIVPAVRAVRDPLVRGLRPTGVTMSRETRRIRSGLVIAEIAASLVLVIGATLFGRSLVALLHSDIGVVRHQVVIGEMNLTLGRTPPASEQIATADRIIQHVAALPAIRHASIATSVPLNMARLRYTLKDVNTGNGSARDYDVEGISVTPDFFATLGVPLLHGRFFAESDTAASQPVMIISARTARRLFGDADPIGRVLSLPSSARPSGHEDATLVGLIGDVKYASLDAPADGGIYRPFRQVPVSFSYLLVQTLNEPVRTARALQLAVAQADARIPLNAVRTLDEVVSRAASEPRFRTLLLDALATIALILASIGLYGAVAYSVSLRTTEIGIRMALGASRESVTQLVVREGMTLAAIGGAVGTVIALALTRVVQGLLYGVGATDAASYVGSITGLLALTALASYVPARRAASVDPLIALRAE